MLRRLHPEQPSSFAFTAANQAWAEAQIRKYPEGRQASAIIPLLWRAQEQEGWLTRPAIEHVATLLGMAYIRALEVATFYFMFQLAPVGKVAHVQICGTLSCMLMGAEDLVHTCKSRIAGHAHQVSDDGKFSWEEVECLGACSNAPMAQIGKDYYEDLTPERLEWILDEMAAGRTPVPGPQNGRYSSEPIKGLTSLTAHESGRTQYNASVELATGIGDTIKRIDGTEVPLSAPWVTKGVRVAAEDAARAAKSAAGVDVIDAPRPVAAPAAPRPAHAHKAEALAKAAAAAKDDVTEKTGVKPQGLSAPRAGQGDNLQTIEGIGPVLEKLCHELGIYHFDQIAAWGEDEIAWMDGNLKGFRGRVTRDKWVAQARLIGEIGIPAFLERAKTNDY